MVWWVCASFYPKKNVYAVGGYLTCSGSMPLCYLCDFYAANFECEAQLVTLEESLQFLLEEVGCIVKELELRLRIKILLLG